MRLLHILHKTRVPFITEIYFRHTPIRCQTLLCALGIFESCEDSLQYLLGTECKLAISWIAAESVVYALDLQYSYELSFEHFLLQLAFFSLVTYSIQIICLLLWRR